MGFFSLAAVTVGNIMARFNKRKGGPPEFKISSPDQLKLQGQGDVWVLRYAPTK